METNDEVELGNYWRIFKRSWWMIAIAMLSMTLLALVFLPGQQTFFTSDVTVALNPGQADVGPVSDPVNEDREIGIATSPLIGTRVITAQGDIERTDWAEDLEVVCVGGTVTSSCDSQLLQFTYAGNTAEEATRLVQASADEYLAFRIEREDLLRDGEISELEGQLDDLALRIANERAVLEAEQDVAEGERTLDAQQSEVRLRLLEEQAFNTQRQLDDVADAGSNVEVGSLLGEPSIAEADATGIPRLFTLIAGISFRAY